MTIKSDEVFDNSNERVVGSHTLLDESTTIIIKGYFASREESNLIDGYTKISIGVYDHNYGRMLYSYVPNEALDFLVRWDEYTFVAHYFQHPTKCHTYTTVIDSIVNSDGNEMLGGNYEKSNN